MTLVNWGLLVLLGAIWGGAFLMAKVAVAFIPPLVLVFLRVVSAGSALHIILRLRRLSFPVTPYAMAGFFVMGLLNNAIPFSLLFWGQTEISAGLASILNATTPIFAFLFAAVLLRQEELGFHRIAGVLLGCAGVAVMLAPSLSGFGEDPLWALLACLGAALSYGSAAAFARRFKGMPPIIAATGQLTGSSIIMLPLAAFGMSGWTPSNVPLTVWLVVAALGLIATAGAYLIYFRLLSEAGATNASLVTLVVPASAVIFGSTLLGETLTAYQVLGLCLLFTGLVVLDGRALHAFTQKA